MTHTELTALKEQGIDPRVHEVVRCRWSPRAFAATPLDDTTLRLLFEAARWAASCANDQPCRFVVTSKDDLPAYEQMLSCLNERNQIWAKLAPVLVVTAARANFAQFPGPNRHGWHDVGLSTGNLMAQATALGVSVHVMAGFDAVRAREVLGIPEGFDPVTAMAIGYPGEPSQLPEDFQAREVEARRRNPLAEVVSSGRWDIAF